MKPKTFFWCLILIMAAGSLSALTLEDLVGPERAAALKSGEPVRETRRRDPRPGLIPRHSYIRELVDGLITEVQPALMAENLFLYPKPARAASRTWTEAERIALYNQAMALSTLTGLQYFSTSRNAMRTFLESSFIIDSPDTKNPRPDPVYTEPPPDLILYAQQRDLTFGENLYQYDYHARQDALVFVQKNLTPMKLGIISAMGREQYRLVLAVIDVADYLLVYAVSMTRATAPGLSQRIGTSFATRAEAIFKWYSERADRAFGGN
ncbi:hypothetical protein FACS1894130_02380 [Spirochaetia bacterium]|nr:hypothetical protein FACS1894130_02380 [Spirochaetia bacterium]